MSKMLAKMNLISVVQQLPKEDIELVQNYVEMIEEESQELKEKNEKEFADFIKFKREQYDEYLEKTNKLIKENQALKKQVEVSNELVAQGTLTEMKLRNEVNRWRKEYQDTYKDVRIEIKEYKTQQKEFISYLENMLDDENDIFSVVRVKDVLQKYEEIIGGSDEKK